MVAAHDEGRVGRVGVEDTTEEGIEPDQHPGRVDATMAGQVGQERLVQNQVVLGRQTRQAAPASSGATSGSSKPKWPVATSWVMSHRTARPSSRSCRVRNGAPLP